MKFNFLLNMNTIKKNLRYYIILVLIIISILFFYFIINKYKENERLVEEPILINLFTSVHPDLTWQFKPLKSKILIKPGEVTNIDYIVENVGEKTSTGIATFVYFPDTFGSYLSKLNCFCYDAQTLKPNEKNKYSLVILLDPEVTKDSKTKRVKEVTIQFTFFDYKKYKEKS